MAQNVKKVASFKYDYTVDGGATSVITPAISESLPAGALVTAIRTEEGVAIAGTATIVFACGATALTGSLAVAAFTGVDLHALTTADGVSVAGGDLTIEIETATLTAGDINVFVEYYY